MGGEDGHGGLLVDNGDGFKNTLKLLVEICDEDKSECDLIDNACVDVTKKLKDENLLTKDNIKDHYLLCHTCLSTASKQRLDFLCDWCPEGIKDCYQYRSYPMIHTIIKYTTIIQS